MRNLPHRRIFPLHLPRANADHFAVTLLQATRAVPIVFVAVADPVAAGFVDSLARPGGRGSITHPTQPLCTLRVRRYRRLTQHSLPGDLLGLTWAGLAPADRASFARRLPLLNHLVGEREQLGGNFEAEGLGGF
jgi:hypothetical protein